MNYWFIAIANGFFFAEIDSSQNKAISIKNTFWPLCSGVTQLSGIASYLRVFKITNLKKKNMTTIDIFFDV